MASLKQKKIFLEILPGISKTTTNSQSSYETDIAAMMHFHTTLCCYRCYSEQVGISHCSVLGYINIGESTTLTAWASLYTTRKKQKQKGNNFVQLINTTNKIKKLLTHTRSFGFLKFYDSRQILWFFMTGWNIILFYDFMASETHVSQIKSVLAFTNLSAGYCGEPDWFWLKF